MDLQSILQVLDIRRNHELTTTFSNLPADMLVGKLQLFDNCSELQTTPKPLIDEKKNEDDIDVFKLLEPSLSRGYEDSLLTELLNEYPSLEHQNQRQGCSCKSTKCLKLYCVCLQKGGFCGPLCQCLDCLNKIENHNAIKRMIVLEGEKYKNLFQGCKCKRSKCKMAYCECHQQGKKCGSLCKCKSCKNQ